MSQIPNPFNSYRQPEARTGQFVQDQATSVAVARFFNAVYAWMSVGLALTAVVAWYVAQPANIYILRKLGLGGLFALAIGGGVLSWLVSNSISRIGTGLATLLFILYAGINGVVLSLLFVVYAHSVLASAFAITAGMFGAMSLFGFVTRVDLSRFAGILFMGVIGLFIASAVSVLFYSGVMNVIVNFIGVLIFSGLTAYYTQMLNRIAIATQGNAALAARMSISGALYLYVSFLNMFLYLVQIMGDRR